MSVIIIKQSLKMFKLLMTIQLLALEVALFKGMRHFFRRN